MIRVSRSVRFENGDLEWQFLRSSGPGGQHVNKTETAVQVRLDIARIHGLDSVSETRLLKLAGRRVTTEGVLVIEARRFRSQDRNRQDALDRLVQLIARSLVAPRPRRKTKPTRASVKRRLAEKKRRGERKSLRRNVKRPPDE